MTGMYFANYMEQSPSEKLTVSQLRNSPNFMEPEGSLPHSQAPTTCPILSLSILVYAPLSHFLKIHLNIILPSTTRLFGWSPSLRSFYQNHIYTSHVSLHATCPAHLILMVLITDTLMSIHFRVQLTELCAV
jgi:hypothetical protein